MAVYDVGDVDNVDGNLYLKIPLLSYPQIGKDLHLNFNIYYNDKAWYLYPIGTATNCGASCIEGTWTSYGFPQNTPLNNMGVYVARDQHFEFGTDSSETSQLYGTGEAYPEYTVTTQAYSYFLRGSDGSKHYYGDQLFQSCSSVGGGASCPTLYNWGNLYPSTDAIGYVPVSKTTIIDPAGVTYSIPPLPPGQNTNPEYEMISDPSGNKIVQTATGWTVHRAFLLQVGI
jgi:hypothetical protein